MPVSLRDSLRTRGTRQQNSKPWRKELEGQQQQGIRLDPQCPDERLKHYAIIRPALLEFGDSLFPPSIKPKKNRRSE